MCHLVVVVYVCVLGALVEVSQWVALLRAFFFQAEDGIRDLVRSRGLGDVYKRQGVPWGKPYSHWQSNERCQSNHRQIPIAGSRYL